MRKACVGDVEISGLTEEMRAIREAQAAEALAEEKVRDKAVAESSLQAEIAKLQDFRDNLERLGLDTEKEDAALARLRGGL